MSRFPPIAKDHLTHTQVGVYEGVESIFSRLPSHIEWQNDEGLIFGPYSSLFYTEDLSDAWFSLAFAVTRQQHFTSKEKELVILSVISNYDAPYLRYAHSDIAVRVGFTEEQVQAAFHGVLPEGLTERESVMYSLGLKLTRMRQPLSDEVFDEARRVLGRDGVARVAHLVSGYIYVAILTNISDGIVPEPRKGMFLATKNPDLELN